jgi:UDP-2,4-diacetamido-2,4,6-trideoxy-beta-L-altropyranose hydrolase
MMSGTGASAVFRFDAGRSIGGGHAMRCLTLAEAMMRSGWDCLFAVSPETPIAVPRLRPYAANCRELSGAPGDEPAEIQGGLDAGRCGLLIVDHYGRDAGFERACRAFAERIAVIDDLADRAHDADILIDQNLGRAGADYAGKVPAGCQLLIGPEFALLRPDFAARRDAVLTQRHGRDGLKRILISFGMTDPLGLSLDTLQALRESGFDGHVDVVIGGAARGTAKVHALAAEMGDKVRVLCDVEDMAELMALADLAVGAGGSTSWERCALGLPALITVVADNQREIACALADAGAAQLVGVDGDGFRANLKDALAALRAEPLTLKRMGVAAAGICDGAGCARVAEALVS